MTKWLNDAGHGGTDPGATGNELVEKILNLEAALYVQSRLKELSISSDVTRAGDVTLSNTQRTALVSKYDRCISHHFNAGGGNGFECIRPMRSDGKFENNLVQEFRNAGFPVRPRAVFTRQLADGRDYYFMHRETGSTLVIIVEYDFVDGPNASKLKDKSYREGMYECVIKAICIEERKEYKAPGSIQTNTNNSNPKPTAPNNNSIVDYLNSIGVDSSIANRSVLAHQHGIANYKGTAAQNIELLNKLLSQHPSRPVPKGNLKTTSVVDYLKSINQDSSMANRVNLARKHGINNYTGTAAQNTQLLNKLRK